MPKVKKSPDSAKKQTREASILQNKIETKRTQTTLKDDKISEYRAEDIKVLKGLEPVRRRPGMYIGGTGLDGLHHLVVEIFDNSRDEAMAGFCDHVEITLLPGNRVRVVDNGRGIPVDIHKATKVSALETIMTTLHAGGKFGEGGYEVSGGLHGVGASVVNALSVYAQAEVHRDGGKYIQEYSKGKRKAKVEKVAPSKKTGTIITFEPDPEIFKEIEFDFEKIVAHMRQQAYLVKGLRVVIIDAREYKDKIDLFDKKGGDKVFYFQELELEVPSQTFYFEGGLRSLVTFYNGSQKPIHKSIFHTEKKVDDVVVEVALQYIDDISSRIVAFANNTYNAEGGTHITGFKTALTRQLNTYAKKNNLLKEDSFTGDDALEGLTAVVSVKMHEIQFEGQTKGRLGSPEARGAVEAVFGEALSHFLEEHPDEARAIIGKVTLALKARKAAKAAKDSVLRKGALEGLMLPGKLADCQTKNAEEAELFIVEGDSAGGSAKMGRDRRTQAVLPLRGKILNVERARIDKMIASKEIKALVIALGASIGDTFNIDKIRYHKIIIATDADVDGSHIRTLLLTLFYRYFKEVIEAGYLYIAMPPLYKIKKGRETFYVYTEEEKEKLVGKEVPEIEEVEPEGDEIPTESAGKEEIKARKPKIQIQRYKGLGEMNPDELGETTMDAKTRTLKQVIIKDVQAADKVFDTLMGAEVAPRKSFIQNNAKLAEIDFI